MIFLWIYLAVAVPWFVMSPKFVYHYALNGYYRPDAEEVFASIFFGLITTIFWPLVVAGFVGYKAVEASTGSSYWDEPKLPRSPAKVLSDRRERKGR